MTDTKVDFDAVLRGDDYYLTPGEVADLFKVDPKTVTRWANSGKVPAIRTLGGHRRFLASKVRELLAANTTERQ